MKNIFTVIGFCALLAGCDDAISNQADNTNQNITKDVKQNAEKTANTEIKSVPNESKPATVSEQSVKVTQEKETDKQAVKKAEDFAKVADKKEDVKKEPETSATEKAVVEKSVETNVTEPKVKAPKALEAKAVEPKTTELKTVETKVTDEKPVEKKVVETKSQALLDKPKATAEKMVSGKTESAKLALTKVETEKAEPVKEESRLADKAKPAKNVKANAKNESSKTAKSSSKDSSKSEADENAIVSSFSMEELRLGAQRSPTKDEIQHLKRQCRYAYMTEQDVIENNCSAKKVSMAR
ncbi:hypothetical protein [Haemophilus sputorum]